jgi:transposase
MIVIGADTHKRTHMLVGVDAGTGQVVGDRQIVASDDGHRDVVRWARGLHSERVWAIEDCRHVSRRLEEALIAAGERVVRVPPKMMGQSRRGERDAGKSDEIDALAVARAVVKDGVERFPSAYLDERAMEIRLLSDHRDDLVSERTRIQEPAALASARAVPRARGRAAQGGPRSPRRARADSTAAANLQG